MKPYIISADTTHPIGEMVAKYGESQWSKGFLIGYMSGFCAGGVLVWILLSKKGGR
jgi:hypothetical protein